MSELMAITDDPVEPVRYHRLAGVDRRHRWWTPLLVGLLAAACYLLVGVLAVVGVLAFSFLTRRRLGDRAVESDLTDPVTFAFSFASIALMLPVLLVARRLLGPRPLGLLSSVAGRLRWVWLRQALWRTGIVSAVSFTVQLFVLGPLTGTGLAPSRSRSRRPGCSWCSQ